MGEKSPLNEFTQSLCEKLNVKTSDFKFDFINLYVSPFAKEVLQKYILNENDEIILFLLYLYHSRTTVTLSLEVLQNENLKQKIQAKIKTIDIFYKNEFYNEMIVLHILTKKSNFDAKTLIF